MEQKLYLDWWKHQRHHWCEITSVERGIKLAVRPLAKDEIAKCRISIGPISHPEDWNEDEKIVLVDDEGMWRIMIDFERAHTGRGKWIPTDLQRTGMRNWQENLRDARKLDKELGR